MWLRRTAVGLAVFYIFLDRPAVAELITAINENREALAQALEEHSPGPSSDREFAEGMHAPVASDLSCKEREQLLNTICSIALKPTSPDATLISITEAVFLRVIVAGLDDACPDVRHEANLKLEDYVRPAHLVPYAAAIKAASVRDPMRVSGTLLSRLPLDDAERAALRERFKDSPTVRARLGDFDAERALIAQFDQANAYDEKKRAAGLLGLAGTHSAGVALAGALKSGLIKETEFSKRSIRLVLIEELAKLNPDEPLLTSEYRKLIAAGGDRGYGGTEAVQAYLERLYQWARRTYGVALDQPDPTPFLLETKHSRDLM